MQSAADTFAEVRMTYIETFIFLQLMDFMTTLAAFKLGGYELSPFIRMLTALGPGTGVAISKLIAFVLGGLAIGLRRHRAIRIINYVFAAIVLWNMIMILRVLGYMRG